MEILLHVCCAPCATTPVTRLLELGHRVSLYFSNHNIDTAAEHDKRLHQVEKLAAHFQTPLLVDERDHEAWRTAVAGLESEPERGERCRVCFNPTFPIRRSF